MGTRFVLPQIRHESTRRKFCMAGRKVGSGRLFRKLPLFPPQTGGGRRSIAQLDEIKGRSRDE
jgi:hypothetical protein